MRLRKGADSDNVYRVASLERPTATVNTTDGEAVSLHFLHYNFARPHKTLADPYPRTPARAVGVADHVWTLREIAGLLD